MVFLQNGSCSGDGVDMFSDGELHFCDKTVLPWILNNSVFRGDCGHNPEGASKVCPVTGFSQGAKGNYT